MRFFEGENLSQRGLFDYLYTYTNIPTQLAVKPSKFKSPSNTVLRGRHAYKWELTDNWNEIAGERHRKTSAEPNLVSRIRNIGQTLIDNSKVWY